MLNKISTLLFIVFFLSAQISCSKADNKIPLPTVLNKKTDVKTGIEFAKAGNYEKARDLWQKAAGDGDVEAQVLLGMLYADGKSVNQSFQEAFKWFYQSAKQGYPLAQFYVASCYNAGKGVEKNDSEAFHWYRLSAEQGNAEAQYNVGAAYANGVGIARDDIQAYAWIYNSSLNGFEFANKYLQEIENRMTSSNLNKAKELAQSLQSKPNKAKNR